MTSTSSISISPIRNKISEFSPAISFQENTIIPKLSRAKAKLKFINVTQKCHYEKNLKRFSSMNSFSLENEEESKVL